MRRLRILWILLYVLIGLAPPAMAGVIGGAGDSGGGGGGGPHAASHYPGGSDDLSGQYATKAYADAISQGLDVKASVFVATTENITLSGEQTIDGELTSANRVLVKNQTDLSENGLYVSDAGAWSRATDADTSGEVTSGLFTFVEAGTQGGTGWVLTTENPITLDTTDLVFTQFSGGGTILAGSGLQKDGNTLSVADNGVALGTKTTGDYVSGATAGGGLAKTGTEGATLGLADCAAHETLKRNAGDTDWECVAYVQSGATAGGDLAGTYPNPTIAANAVALGTDTTGNYVAGATSAGGLAMTGTEGGTLGLQDCAAHESLKRNAADNDWECVAYIQSGAAAGGDLTGTYPNPTIAANAVALGTDTTGDYVAGTTADGGLVKAGTEGATLSLKPCAASEVLRRNVSNSDWECVAGASITGTAGGDLSGTYPNPSVQDDSHGHTSSTISGLTDASFDPDHVDGEVTVASLRTLGPDPTQAAPGNDGRFPTADQKAALAGTEGTPSTANPFVTTSDTRVPPHNDAAETDPPDGVECHNVDIEGVVYRVRSTWYNVPDDRFWRCVEKGGVTAWKRFDEGGTQAFGLEQSRAAGNTITGAVSEATAVTYSVGGMTVRTWVDPSEGYITKLSPSGDKVFVLDAGTKFAIESATSGSPLFACTPETGCTGVIGDEDNPIIPTEQQVLDVSTGRVGPFDLVKPRVEFGTTLEVRRYEQGGNWIEEVLDSATQTPIPQHVNVPAGLTKIFLGDGVDIFTLDADTATQTYHTAPLFDDGLKLTLNPNGTNAGLNIGSQAGDPSSLANGDVWYNSSTNKFRCRENGATTDCIGASSGAPIAPILPSSAIPVTAGMVYGCPIDGDMLLCVTTATLLTSDAIWRLNFEMPPTLATGCTYKLQLDGKANAASGVLRINPKWATWAPGVTRTSLSLQAESVTPDSVTGAAGSGDTVTWGTGDENQLLRVKWTLNASTVTAGQRIAMDLTFEDASTTLAVESGWQPSVVCE